MTITQPPGFLLRPFSYEISATLVLNRVFNVCLIKTVPKINELQFGIKTIRFFIASILKILKVAFRSIVFFTYNQI